MAVTLQMKPTTRAVGRLRPRAILARAGVLPQPPKPAILVAQTALRSSRRRGAVLVARAAPANADDGVDSEEKDELDAFRAALQGTVATEVATEETEDASEQPEDMMGEPMDGEELRALVVGRWGRAYDTRISQRRNKINQMRLHLQVMWKFLGQKSFPLSEQQYMDQLEAVAELLTEWGCADQIRREIPASKKNPVLDTTGANAVTFLLDVDIAKDAM